MKYLESNPNISAGQFVLKGTRIRVSHLMSKLLAGQTIEQIHTEWYPQVPLATLRARSRKRSLPSTTPRMPKRFHKYKLLLDENMAPRQRFPRLNEHYDVKHVRDDLHRGGSDDPSVYRLAVAQGRILVTENWTDFRSLVGTANDPGVIGVPPHWQPRQVDTQLTALLRRHSPTYFTGRVRTLGRGGGKADGVTRDQNEPGAALRSRRAVPDGRTPRQTRRPSRARCPAATYPRDIPEEEARVDGAEGCPGAHG